MQKIHQANDEFFFVRRRLTYVTLPPESAAITMSSGGGRTGATIATSSAAKRRPGSGSSATSSSRGGSRRGLGTKNVDLGLDQIDEIGVGGVLQESAGALTRNMQGEARETCSALAISLLQTLGPFNYVRMGSERMTPLTQHSTSDVR